MATNYKFDYKEPENITSEVPGEQNLREGASDFEEDDEKSTLNDGNTTENSEKYVLSPVVTVTTNEATFTKGDLKLQKISVTENVSDSEDAHLLNPGRPHIFSQVPQEQTIRMDPGERKTRIPTRFKNAVNRVRRDRSMPTQSDGEISLPPQPRRSSIPRLRQKPPTRPDPSKRLTLEEFDKLYNELGPVEIDVSLLNNQVEDPIVVEDKFEEIIHDYKEGLVKPISVEDLTRDDVAGIAKDDKIEEVEEQRSPAAERQDLDGPESINNHTNAGTEYNSKSTQEQPKAQPRHLKRTASVENSVQHRRKSIDKNRRKSIDKALNSIKQAVNDRRKSVDKTANPEKRAIDERRKSVEKAANSEKHTAGDRRKSVDKTTNPEKPKSRIPMFKRPSEPEIEVPKSNAKQNMSFREKVKVHNAASKFAKDNDVKDKQHQSKIVISKKEVIEKDELKDSNMETTKVEVKHELQVENIEIHGSYESDLSPDNIIKVENVTVEPNIVKENYTINEIGITPPTQAIDTNEYEETVIEPCQIEYEDVPVTDPVKQNDNEAYIDENKTQNPTVPVTEYEPIAVESHTPTKTELIAENNIPTKTEFKLSPVKVASIEEMDNMATRITLKSRLFEMKQKYEPDTISNNQHNINSNINNNEEAVTEVLPVETVILEATPMNTDVVLNEININSGHTLNAPNVIRMQQIRMNESSKEEAPITDLAKERNTVQPNYDDETPILKGKVSRIINRLSSIEDKVEPKEIKLDLDNPKKKSVMSKIAMFEKQAPPPTSKPIYCKPKPKPEPEPYKPKIINEVLKPQRRPYDDGNKAYNAINNGERFIGNTVTGKVEVNVKGVAIASTIETEEIVCEELPPAYENKPFGNSNVIENRKTKSVHKETILKSVDNEIHLQPIEVVYENLNEFEPKSKDNTDDVIILNHVEKSAQFETSKKREIKSPFNFQPKIDSRKDENPNFKPVRTRQVREPPPDEFIPSAYKNTVEYYDEDEPNEYASLDNDLHRLGRYKSRFEDTNLRKAKSVAELDLGDAVKGKVHEMIMRMKSIDRSKEKKEVISAKERPKKKTVLERIALFEGKHQTSVPLPRAAPLRAASPSPLPQTMEPDILQARVQELTRPHPRVDKMEYIQLADGRNMPALLVGTALLDQHLAPYIIMAAIDMGYRGIDTAWVYGNEKIVGEAIRKKIEDGTVKREDLFIVNKLWSTFHREDLVLEACQRSLDNMGLDYFDLYLLHNPMSFKEGLDPIPKVAGVIQYSTNDYISAWRGLEQLPASGLARGLGLSNCAARQLQRALQGAAVEPLVNMVECHPYLNQQRLHDFCAERNVTLVAYGALGSRGTPAALRGDAAPVIGDPLVQVMAAGLGVTPAQLLISYQIHSGHPVAVKASTAAHLWDNLGALKLKLTDAQMDALNALNKNKRMFQFKGMGDTHKNYPFNDPF